MVPQAAYIILICFFLIIFSSSCSDWLFFLLPYISNHWVDSWLPPFNCCFPVNCSLFQLVYLLFLNGYFFMLLSLLSSLSILKTSVLNSVSIRLLASMLFRVFFLTFCSVLSFGTCFLVSSFWQPPSVCFYVLGRVATSPGLGRMA